VKRVTVFSSREFNRDIGAAKRAAEKGPVIVTERGAPAYVLMTHAEYGRLLGAREVGIMDHLRQIDEPDVEFELKPLRDGLFRAADLD
jgi:prevent-host-death family protein